MIRFLLLLLVFKSGFGFGTILQVVTDVAPPLQFMEGNELKGKGTEIVRAVLREAEFDAEFHVYPWARSYSLAQRERNTLVFPLLRTAEREKKFQWIGIIGQFKIGFVMLEPDVSVSISNIEQMKQYRIGVMRDDFTHHYILDAGFLEGSHFLLRSSMEELVQLLYSQKIDTFMTDFWLTKETVKMLGYDPNRMKVVHNIEDLEQDVYLAANKNTPIAIVGKLQRALKKIKAMPRYEHGFRSINNPN